MLIIQVKVIRLILKDGLAMSALNTVKELRKIGFVTNALMMLAMIASNLTNKLKIFT